jgi:hypothetical protein
MSVIGKRRPGPAFAITGRAHRSTSTDASGRRYGTGTQARLPGRSSPCAIDQATRCDPMISVMAARSVGPGTPQPGS